MEKIILINTVLEFMWIFVAVTKCDKQEICSTESYEGRCPDETVIVMEMAVYGRMRLGTCIEVDYGLGCQNDILYLADRWCSGRQECDVLVPNRELKAANTECVKELTQYMEVDYSCVRIVQPQYETCSMPERVHSHGHEGYLSSHVTIQTGCGSSRAPWVIEVPHGQTIDVWLHDFGALGRSGNTLGLGCQQTLGYIAERNLGSNFTICGANQRKKHVYTSKTNIIEITMIPNAGDETSGFLVHYSVIGCSDLTPPAHAWYKREGSEAVIGCKSDDRVWRLYCNGNTWDGVVGNCSKSKSAAGEPNNGIELPFSSVIFLTSVVCGAILLIIVVVVAGAVYVKKQSIRHEIKLRSDYACTTLPSAQYFPAKTLGYDVTLDRSMIHSHHTPDNQPLVQISDRTVKNREDMTLMPNCVGSPVQRGSN